MLRVKRTRPSKELTRLPFFLSLLLIVTCTLTQSNDALCVTWRAPGGIFVVSAADLDSFFSLVTIKLPEAPRIAGQRRNDASF